MFGDSNNKIGTRELTAIIMYMLGIELSNATPTFLFKDGKNAAWMLPFVSGLIAFISLGILLKLLKKYENKGLMDIVYELTGKYVGFIIGMLLFFIMLFYAAINSRSYVDIINVVFFIKTPTIILYIILIGSSLFIAKRGFEAIGRTSYITQPYVLTAVFVYLVLILRQCHFEYLKPILGAGIKEIITSGAKNSSMFADIIVISVIYKKVIGYKEYKLASIIGLSFGIIIVSIFCMIFVAVFDYPPVVIINYLFHTAARVIYVGRFIGNMEAFFLIFWLVAALVRYSVYIYIGTAFLAYTLQLKEVKPLLLLFSALALMFGMLPENYFQAVELIKRMVMGYSGFFIYSLPVILFMLSNIKEKKKVNQ